MGYAGWALDQHEINGLKGIFTPSYPDVLAHHVTLAFGVDKDFPIPEVESAFLYGYVNDGAGVEAFVVEINGTLIRPDGKTYHITWSIDREAGAKPVHSNRAIEETAWEPLPLRVPIKLIPYHFD